MTPYEKYLKPWIAAHPERWRKHQQKYEQSEKGKQYRAKLNQTGRRKIRDAKCAGVDVNSVLPKPKHCEVCGNTKKICLDHCHERKVFRGWICHNCNVVLGHVGDDQMILLVLSKYLQNFANRTRLKQ